jgi:hypothetical protein
MRRPRTFGARATRRREISQTVFQPDFPGISLLDSQGVGQYKTATFRQAVNFSIPDQDASKRLDPQKFRRCL